MVRGLFTAASGMNVQQNRLDEIANNLANVDLNGHKKDTAIEKAFPEMLIRRHERNGVYTFPFGSMDTAPIVGTVGTGVETTRCSQTSRKGRSSRRRTTSTSHWKAGGSSPSRRRRASGSRAMAASSSTANWYLVTKNGDFVLGENGPMKLKKNNFVIDEDGTVWQNASFAADDKRLVSQNENTWDNMQKVDRLKVVDVTRERYMKKQGNSYWTTTDESGLAQFVTTERPKVRQGYLEGANVNAVQEMVEMIEVNRAYDANQKTIQTEDSLIGKLWNEVVKV